MLSKTKTKVDTKVKTEEKEATSSKNTSKLTTFVIALIVVFIFGYITFDYFVVKQKIEDKIVMVNSKFDSLQLYLDNKLPEIDKALQIQEQQVKNLQQMKSSFIKK